jgi:hypothetical protein
VIGLECWVGESRQAWEVVGDSLCFFRVQASFGAQAKRRWRMAMDPIVWVLVIDSTPQEGYLLARWSVVPPCTYFVLRPSGIMSGLI